MSTSAIEKTPDGAVPQEAAESERDEELVYKPLKWWERILGFLLVPIIAEKASKEER